MKILIVDDNDGCRAVLQAMLATYGDCETAEDGALGVKAFNAALTSNNPFDLIFMDIMMPNMTGRDALRNIRDIEKNNGIDMLSGVKIIMMTVCDDKSNIIGSFSDQCEAYLLKPVSKAKIIETINELTLPKPI